MKEHWEQECAALRAELAALQQQVRALAAQQMEGKAVSRWGASKSMRFVLLPLFVLLASGGVLYGQGAMDALFIDPSGKVGIGINPPNATLDVAGTLNVSQKASLAATEVKGTLDVTQKTNLSDTTIKGSLTTDGNVGIGTTPPTFSLHLATGKALRIEGGTNASDNGNYFSFGGHGAFGIDAPSKPNGRFVVLNNGNVGIGVPEPSAALQVNGGFSKFQYNSAASTQPWPPTDDSGGGLVIGGNRSGDFAETNFYNVKPNAVKAFQFTQMTATDAGRDIMTMKADGNVGIGTTDPKAKLDVNGFILGHNPLDRAFRDREAPDGQSDSARARAILEGKPDGTFMLAGPNKNNPTIFYVYWKSGGEYYRGWIGDKQHYPSEKFD